MTWPESPTRIELSLAQQVLSVIEHGETLLKASVSTAKNGPGNTEGSFCTPTGRFLVRERIGEGAPIFTNFVGRVPKKVWKGERQTDAILSRILWLEGLDTLNENTYRRYIYFHGTHEESLIGQAASHGCIRLKNKEMMTLFELCPLFTRVHIF